MRSSMATCTLNIWYQPCITSALLCDIAPYVTVTCRYVPSVLGPLTRSLTRCAHFSRTCPHIVNRRISGTDLHSAELVEVRPAMEQAPEVRPTMEQAPGGGILSRGRMRILSSAPNQKEVPQGRFGREQYLEQVIIQMNKQMKTCLDVISMAQEDEEEFKDGGVGMEGPKL